MNDSGKETVYSEEYEKVLAAVLAKKEEIAQKYLKEQQEEERRLEEEREKQEEEQKMAEKQEEGKKKGKAPRKRVIEGKIIERGVPDRMYVRHGAEMDKPRSIFAILDTLNKRTDIMKFTKNTIPTILKRLYSPAELELKIKKSGCANFEEYSQRVMNAYNNNEPDVSLSAVAESVRKFKEKVKEAEIKRNKDHGRREIYGPQSLVHETVLALGDNRYYLLDKKCKEENDTFEMPILQMAPLFVGYSNDTDAEEKVDLVNDYIKETYGYKLEYLPANVSYKKYMKHKKDVLVMTGIFSKKMNVCVNMLYTVARNMVGSQKVTLEMARELLDERRSLNGYLHSIRKYEGKKVKKIFEEQCDIIKDVVTTLTTIFMARFVFNAPAYVGIEKYLTQQAAFKLKSIQFNNDINEDYWVNELIEDRLKVNLNQVLAANKITNVNQLIDVYNKNGTIVEEPERIHCIDDLIFAKQYCIDQRVNNKKIEDVKESVAVAAKPVIKEQEKVEVKKPAQEEKIEQVEEKFEKLNKIYNGKLMQDLQKTDEYKKYYEEYKNSSKAFDLDITSEQLAEEKEVTPESKPLSEEKVKTFEIYKVNEDTNADALVGQESIDFDALTKVQFNEEDEKEVKQKVFEQFKVNEDANADALIGQESFDFDALLNAENKEEKENEIFENKILNEEKTKIFDSYKVNEDENADALVGQQSFDFDKLTATSAKKEEESKKQVIVYKTEKSVDKIPEEKLAKKVKKYFSEIINGSNGKVGVIGENLNYRVIEDLTNSNTSDGKRLNDKELTKANKIRSEKIKEVVDLLTNSTLEYFENNKDGLTGERIPKLCNQNIKAKLGIEEGKTFTKSDLKKCVSVMITKLVNDELKDTNIELYTGKNTYKKFNEKVNNILEGK